MSIPRLSDTVLVNNGWLVGVALAMALLLLWAGSFGGALGVRWLFRTSRVDVLARVGERVVRVARTTAILVSPVLVLAAVAVLGYGTWQGEDLQRWIEPTTAEWTTSALARLGQGVGGLLAIALAVVSLRALAERHLPRLHERMLRVEALTPHREALTTIVGDLPEVLSLVLAYVGVVELGRVLALEGASWTIGTLFFVGLVFNAARLLVRAGWLALEVFDRMMLDMASGTMLHEYYERVHPLMPLARRALEATIYVTGAIVVVHRFEALEVFVPFGSMSIELIVVFFVTRVLVAVVGVLVHKLLLHGISEKPDEGLGIEQGLELQEARARRMTLAQLTQGLCRFALYVGMAMVMLVVVGVDPMPLLAGLGVVGFAVGLGSQKILQDIICGFFMLLEDQMLIGDYVKVQDTEGVVEQLHLRVSRIRDRFGRVHTIRNGDVGNVINYSRGWTLAVVEMSVAYESDLPTVLSVMRAAGEELHRTYPSEVLAPSEIMGIEAMEDSCLRVRTETRVRPGCHYEMKRALNRLLFEAFVAHGIEIPYPKGIEFDGVPPPSTPPSVER